MKKPITTWLRPALLGVLAAAVLPTASAQSATLVAGWDFERIEEDGVSIKSVVGNYVGVIENSAILTDVGGGRPGAGGGRGFDVSANNPGWLYLEASGDDNPLNVAAENDQTTIVLWQRNNNNINSSSFWAQAEGFDRAYQFHIPWSDGTIYFDTAGGCCAANQRQSMNVLNVFPEHDWLAWNHYAFVKDGPIKRIYINGELLVEGEGYDPVPTTGTHFTIGGQNRGSPPDAVIDDFAIFKGILTVEQIQDLAEGGSPFAPPVDTDGDGMPDDWETQYGFNPANPADASQDADGDGATNLQEYQAGTNPTDTTKPVLNSAAGTATFDQVILTFSENLDPVSATTLANYSITPSLAITAATHSKGVVTLTTAAQTPGATAYTVTVNNVLDTSKNAVAANSSAKFYSYLSTREGVLKFSFWGGITGTPVENLTFDPRYPATPDWTGAVFSFNSRDILPNDSRDNYGATIEGYLTPAESGNYDFFLRSDDASELWISTDATEANASLQAYEFGCCDPFKEPGAEETTVAPLALVAGQRYFIRVIYKEGGGGDYAQVAWRNTTSTTPAGSLQPIPGRFLSSAVDLPAPPEGAFLTTIPAPNARNVSPATRITVSHRDGKTAWTDQNVTMLVDGQPVTPTFTKVGNVLTVDYVPPALLASESAHTVRLNYLDPGGEPASREWSFTVQAYRGPTKDKVASRSGLITGNSNYSADRGGHSGQAGDYAMDLAGAILVPDATFANPAAAADELSVSLWTKKYNIADGSAFWFNSATAGGNRGFQAHLPWSNNNIYFDTAGCCDPPQRINAHIDTFAAWTGENTFWTDNWHHFVFSKKGGIKQIWIDGILFLEGADSAPLPADMTSLYIGSDGVGGGVFRALMDDFAVFSTQLTEAQIQQMVQGALPSALPASAGLVAYWDFNDAATTVPPTISINGSTITYTGTLQRADTLNGTFSNVAGATSPYTVPAGTENAYFRSTE